MSDSKPPPHLEGLVLAEMESDLLVRVLSSIQNFVLLVDSKGVVRFINKVFEVHGSAVSVVGMPVTGFLKADSVAVLETAMLSAQQNRVGPVVELQMREPAVWLQTQVLSRWKDGDFEGYLLISSDVTDLKAAQEELKTANAYLERVLSDREALLMEESTHRQLLEERLVESQRLQSLGALASGVAHEYNNLLTVILGNSGLAQMLLPEDSAAREAIKHLETATLHAAELTNQLLTYSGHARVKIESIDLSVAMTELATLVETTLKGGKTLFLKCDSEVPPVLGDLGQLQQILMHLVRQASKHCGDEPGEITVETGVSFLSESAIQSSYLTVGISEGRFAYVCVRDNGTPLTSLQRRHFFEPFSPHGRTHDGLGMAAVLGIVRSYGGTAEVKSGFEGTQVSLYFPLGTGDLDDAGKESRSHLTVLLVEQEQAVLGTMESLLRHLGYSVASVFDGHSAVEWVNENPGVLGGVFLDTQVSELSAVECFAAIRKISPSVPILLMSNYSEEQVRSQFVGHDYAGILRKPFRLPDLASLVTEIVGAG